jgi:hypothetical protein
VAGEVHALGELLAHQPSSGRRGRPSAAGAAASGSGCGARPACRSQSYPGRGSGRLPVTGNGPVGRLGRALTDHDVIGDQLLAAAAAARGGRAAPARSSGTRSARAAEHRGPGHRATGRSPRGRRAWTHQASSALTSGPPRRTARASHRALGKACTGVIVVARPDAAAQRSPESRVSLPVGGGHRSRSDGRGPAASESLNPHAGTPGGGGGERVEAAAAARAYSERRPLRLPAGRSSRKLTPQHYGQREYADQRHDRVGRR